MNVDDKIVVGDSGEGIAEVGGGTDEGANGVYPGTNVVGSNGAAAAVIAVVTQGMLLKEILIALRPALVAGAWSSDIGSLDILAVIELREALVEALLLRKKTGSPYVGRFRRRGLVLSRILRYSTYGFLATHTHELWDVPRWGALSLQKNDTIQRD
jgi:hypothetical protein